MTGELPGLAAALGLFSGGTAGILLLGLPDRIFPLEEPAVPLREIPGRWTSSTWWAAATYPLVLGLAWLALGVGTAVFYLRTLPDHQAVAILLWSLGMSCNLALARSAYESLFAVTGDHPTPWSLGGRYRFRSRARIRLLGVVRMAISVPTIAISLGVALSLSRHS